MSTQLRATTDSAGNKGLVTIQKEPPKLFMCIVSESEMADPRQKTEQMLWKYKLVLQTLK